MTSTDDTHTEALSDSLKTADSFVDSTLNCESTTQAICLVGDAANNEQLRDILKNHYSMDVYDSPNGIEYINRQDMSFVLSDFSGPDYNYLFHAGRRIYGPTIIFESAKENSPLPCKQRPIFCNSMKDITLCFCGIHEKKQLSFYVDIVHHMGGSVRRGYTLSVTHVVANTTQSSKYRLAVGMGKKAMRESWILNTWAKRNIPMTSALSPDLIKLTLPPFHCLKLHFHGFSVSEESHIAELAQQHGGSVASPESCTHYVIEPSVKLEDLCEADRQLDCHFVTVEWFWVSIQLNICANEAMYGLAQMHKHRKGMARRQTDAHLAAPSSTTVGSVSLDVSSEMSSMLGDHMFSSEEVGTPSKLPQRGMTKRHQVAIEIEQTESKYVDILKTIITMYKMPLENQEAMMEEPLLDATDIKQIFSNLPPIYQVHSKLSRDLSNMICHWNEERLIGNVWLRHMDELAKAYPPYVNFFERTKEVLSQCDSKKPRFHAFLKARQNRPDSNRESLQELLIRPVQRLPSVELLLRELLKHTDKSNADYADLCKAVELLKKVLTYINEDKRKTEGQVKLFDIVNKIENCPPYLLASRRQYMGCMHVVALCSGAFTKAGSSLTLFLFNDCMEVAKRKSRTVAGGESTPTENRLRHVELLFLSNVRRVVDVSCFPDYDNLFCLTIRNNMGDTSYPFRTDGDTPTEQKNNFLDRLCSQVLRTSCRTEMEVQYLDDLEKCSDTELVFAVQKAMKTFRNGRRMSRAFSFTKTHKRLRRVVSNMATSVSGHLRRMSKSNIRLPLTHLSEELSASPNKATLDAP